MSDADSVDLGWGTGAEVNASSTRAALWQVNTRGRKVVEMTDAELLVSFKAGKVTARSLVWSEGMAEWAPVEEVPRLMKLTRPDSEPPASGARPIADQAEAGTKGYTSSGSEPPTDPGTLAVYERPLATIEFPQAIEASEPAEEPTPAFGMPPKALVTAAAPKTAREPAPPARGSLAGAQTPALPPLPTRPPAAFPAPVSSSPLGAALSSTVAPSPVPPVATTSASAKTTPLSTPMPALKSQPRATLSSAAATPTSWPPGELAARVTAGHPALALDPPPKLPVADRAPLVSPPRPAIEFLPPIIVQEKEDDGTSLLDLPLEAPFHESTLVLSGRRGPRRWVPLNAAVAAAVGAACLASALTALIVKSQPPPPPRIVEKRVFVPAPTPTAAVTAAATVAVAAPPAAPIGVRETASTKTSSEPERTSVSERKSDTGGSASKARESWRRDDPGPLEAASPSAPRRERAGFPTNPGF